MGGCGSPQDFYGWLYNGGAVCDKRAGGLVSLVYLVCLVVRLNRTDQTDQMNQINPPQLA